jgi:hypothetical protein
VPCAPWPRRVALCHACAHASVQGAVAGGGGVTAGDCRLCGYQVDNQRLRDLCDLVGRGNAGFPLGAGDHATAMHAAIDAMRTFRSVLSVAFFFVHVHVHVHVHVAVHVHVCVCIHAHPAMCFQGVSVYTQCPIIVSSNHTSSSVASVMQRLLRRLPTVTRRAHASTGAHTHTYTHTHTHTHTHVHADQCKRA